LPDGDGFTVIERIRQTALTPIVVLSARGDVEGKVRALELGADDYVTKPFDMTELLARL
jgi:two-component system KDP operon response regulator KdpE